MTQGLWRVEQAEGKAQSLETQVASLEKTVAELEKVKSELEGELKVASDLSFSAMSETDAGDAEQASEESFYDIKKGWEMAKGGLEVSIEPADHARTLKPFA